MLRKWILKRDNSEVVFWYQEKTHRPEDKIEETLVSDIVFEWALKERRSEAQIKLADQFLKQWPAGKQLNHVPGKIGRPKKPDDRLSKTVRFPKEYLELIEGNASKFIIQAVKEKIDREKKL